MGYLIFFFLLLASCALLKMDNYKRPLMRHTERELYVIDAGWDLKTEEKLAFQEGRIIPGMRVTNLLLIYGTPDLSLPCPKGQNTCDRVWIYEANNTETVGSVSIRDTLVVYSSGQMAKPCRF